MFRLTVREMILLTALVGLTLGWWLDRARLNAAHAEVKQEAKLLQAYLERNGAKVTVASSTITIREGDKASVYVNPAAASQ